MPGIGDQQVLQQLLTGMNTMQMQAGLMPGGVPALNNQNTYRPPPAATPAQFSNDLSIHLRNTFSYQPLAPPMFGGITPVPRTQEAQGYLPGPTMGGGWGMARQQAQGNASKFLTSAQATTGFGARGAFGLGVGAVAGGLTMNPWIGAAAGAGADYLMGDVVERMAQMPFKPLIDQQQRAMQLQNMSMNNVRRGSDLSASGMGLSLTASMDLERNLMRTADNRNFKRDTGGMFNRQDMMKLTEISSQVGLLDNAQSVDQISRDMGKIGRALSTFMKVVEEPDVRKALSMMGNMRQLGMSIPETNVAAANARTFARMAGTTVQGVMQAGMQGAGMFQQYGMSGATGLGVGMAAAGAAGTMSTILDPRTLNLLGGREGVAQTLTGAAAQMSQITAILPGMLKRGKDGKLTVDEDAMGRLTRPGGIDELVRGSASRTDNQFIQEYSHRKGALQDEFMNKMGPMGAILMPVLLAKRFMSQTGISDIGAGLRGIGLDEKQSETIAQLYQSPDFYKAMRQQQRTLDIEQQKIRGMRSQSLADVADADVSRRFSRGLGNAALDMVDMGTGQVRRDITAVGNGANNWMRSEAEDADLEEQQIAAGGGRLLRAVRPGALTSAAEQRGLAERLRTDKGASEFNEQVNRYARRQRSSADILRSENRQYMAEAEQIRSANPLTAIGGLMSRTLIGPDGSTGFADIGRGGESSAETLMESEDFGTRLRNGTLGTMVGLNDKLSLGQLERRQANRKLLGRQVEQGLATPNSTGELNRLTEKYALKDKDMANVVGKATAAVSALLKSKTAPLGWEGTYVSSRTTGDEIDRTIRAAIGNVPGLDAGKNAALAQELRSEIIRTVGNSAGSSEKLVLDRLAKGGADIAGNDKAAVQQYHANKAEYKREAIVSLLGMDTGFFGNTESQREVIDIFAKEDNALQQKYLAVASMEAAGNKEGAEALRTQLRLDKKYTDEQRAGAESGARKAVAGMDENDKANMGKKFSAAYSDKKHGGLYGITKTVAGLAATAQDVSKEEQMRARVGVLGVEGADIFAKDGVRGLKKHLESGGVLEGASESLVKQIREGALTPADVDRKIQKRREDRASGTFAGGLVQMADKIGAGDFASDALETLENMQEEDAAARPAAAAAEGDSLGAAASNLDAASAKLLEAATSLAHTGDRGDLRETLRLTQ